MIELSFRIEEYLVLKKKLDKIVDTCWILKGEKKKQFTELLLNFIELNWDIIFENDYYKLNIKFQVVNDISNFLVQNQELCEYAWINIIKQHIQESLYLHNCQCVNAESLNQKECYLENLKKFNEKFNIELLKYETEYNFRKRQWIAKYKYINNVKAMRPIYLYFNRNYYKLFEFSTKRQNTMKEWLSSTIYNEKMIIKILKSNNMSPKVNKKETEMLRLALTTLKKTHKLFELKHSKFICCVLNRIFYKDIVLNTIEYI